MTISVMIKTESYDVPLEVSVEIQRLRRAKAELSDVLELTERNLSSLHACHQVADTYGPWLKVVRDALKWAQ